MRKLLPLALVLFVCPPISAQELTITRFAGDDGGQGFVDATGMSARFDSPRDVVADAAGNVYVADYDAHVIRKITPAGVVSTFAGRAGESGLADGRGGAARFWLPGGIAIDLSGNLFVGDSGNNRVRRISPSGVVTTFGGPGPGLGTYDVAVDSSGNVYVGAFTSIRKYSASGSLLATYDDAGISGASRLVVDAADQVFYTTGTAVRKLSTSGFMTTISATFSSGFGLGIDESGDLYVSDWGGDRIYKLTQAGTKTIIAGSGVAGSNDGIGVSASFNSPWGIATAPGNLLYLADTFNHSIRQITLSNAMVTTVAGRRSVYGGADGPANVARFYQPADAVFDSGGNLFVTNWSTIRKITPGGTVSTFAGTAGTWGSADGTGAAARFLNPHGIAVDSADNLYVSDLQNSTIRKITPGGVVTTFAGSAGQHGAVDGTGSAARFYSPAGIVMHPSGDLYVADYGNQIIRRITPDGAVTTFAGTAGEEGSSDGTGSAARFRYPLGLDVDASGDLYVADYGNFTIRKITVPGAEVTTVAGVANSVGSTDGTGSAARFYAPGDLAVYGGDIYVVDGGNGLLRRMTPAGEVTTIAGSARSYAHVEGTGSFARFWNPIGIASDGNGNFYVCDQYANNILHARLPGIDDVATASSTTPALNSTVQLDTAPGTATTWEWKIFRRPAGSIAELSATNIRNPTFAPDVDDLFVLLLRAEGSGGVRFSTVDVTPAGCAPLASVVATVPSQNVCINSTGATASVAVSGGGTLAYQWGWRATSGGAITAIGGATSATYVLNGADFGSAGTKLLVVTVTPSCGPPLVSNQIPISVTTPPTVTLSASSGVFANGPHNFASVAAYPGGTYTWSIANGTINSGQGTRSIEYTASASGEVTLGVQVAVGGCTVSAGATVPIIERAPGAVLLYTVTPCRVFDTRVTAPALASNATRTVAVTGVCGVPSSAKAVVINLTAVAPGGMGWLTVFPADQALPATSTLNYAPAKTRANNAIVPLSTLGALKVYNYNNTASAMHFILDVAGYLE